MVVGHRHPSLRTRSVNERSLAPALYTFRYADDGDMVVALLRDR